MGIGLYGPPIPGAPWLRPPEHAHARSRALRPAGVDPPKPLLPRLTERDDMLRVRRAVNSIVEVLNSLIQRGQLEKVGVDDWAAHLFEGLATEPRLQVKEVLEADLPDDAENGEVAITTDTKKFCWRTGGVWYCTSQDAVEEAGETARLVPFGLLLSLTKRA